MIDVTKELDDAKAKLPVTLDDVPMSLDFQIRQMALLIAQRHVGDTSIKEGALYQQLKMDNKLGGPATVDIVIIAALAATPLLMAIICLWFIWLVIYWVING